MYRRAISCAVVAVATALSLTGCGGGSSKGASPTTGPTVSQTSAATGNGGAGAAKVATECDTAPLTCNSGEVTSPKTGTFAYTIEKDIQDWDLLTNAGNTFDTQEALDAIYPNVFEPQPDLTYKLSSDYFTSVEQTSTSPQT